MTDRKHASAAFWITMALLAVLVGYPLSFGPACWITSWTRMGADITAIAYQPLIGLIFEPSSPDCVVNVIVKYGEFMSRPGWMFSKSSERCHWGIVL